MPTQNEVIANAVANLIMSQPDGEYIGTIDQMRRDCPVLASFTKNQITGTMSDVRKEPARYGYSFPRVGAGRRTGNRWIVLDDNGRPLDRVATHSVTPAAHMAALYCGQVTRYIQIAESRAVAGTIAAGELRCARQAIETVERALDNAVKAVSS